MMARDVGSHLTSIRVDGGMSQNDLLIQLQSDILGIPIGKTSSTTIFTQSIR